MSTPPREKRKIAVIGSGIGGLASAVELAHTGCKVVVFEKENELGGRLCPVKKDGFTWDADPVAITQPQVLRALWKRLGRNLEDDLTLVQLPVSCRCFWSDGSRLDNDKALRQNEEVARYLAYGKDAWQIAELFNSIHGNWLKLLSRKNFARLAHAPKLLPWESMHRVTRRFFSDQRLIQLFDHSATGFGSSPRRTPGVLSYASFLEAEFGTWQVQGGNHQIIQALIKIAEALGVEFRLGCEVTGVYDSNVAIDGKWLRFDAVVCNQDVLMAYQSLLPRKRCGEFRNSQLDKNRTALSSFTLHLGVNRQYESLSDHNLFFSDDSEAEFRQLIAERFVPEQPTIALSVSSRNDPSLAPKGCDNWTLRVDVPPIRSSIKWDELAESYGNQIIERLETRFGFDGLSQHVVARVHQTPSEVRSRFQCFGGALQGFAPHGLRNALIGPAIEPPGISGFFFTGASMRPSGSLAQILRNSENAVYQTLRHLKNLPLEADL